MALTPQGRELTEAHKQAQIELAVQAVGESKRILELLDPFRLDATRTDWLGFQVDSALRHHDASVNLAGAYLNAYRAIEGELDDLVMAEFDPAPAAVSADSMVVARAKQLTGTVGPRQALTGAWGWYSGSLMATVLAGGRNTLIGSVESSRFSLGWRRVTDGNPCAFCAMLASRGPAYTSAESAGRVTGVSLGGRDYKLMDAMGGRTPERRALIAKGRASRKGLKRPLGSRFHDSCGCTVEEVFDEWVPSKREQAFIDLYQASAGGSTRDVLSKMRANGSGIVNDAVKHTTQTGGAGGGGKPPRKPPVSGGGAHPDWRRALGSKAHGEGSYSLPKARIEDHEAGTGRRLAALGVDVEFLDPVNVEGRKNPDARINGEIWEFKAPQGSSEKNTIASQFKRAGRQSENVVIDLVRCGLPDDLAVQQCMDRFRRQDTIRKLLVLDKQGGVAFFGDLH